MNPGRLRHALEAGYLTTGQVAQYFPATWLICPASMSPEDATHWRFLFDATGFVHAEWRSDIKKWVVTAGDPPPLPQLYRGADDEHRLGWSWTDSLKAAKRYARLGLGVGHGELRERSNVWATQHGAVRMIIDIKSIVIPGGTEYVIDPTTLTEVNPLPVAMHDDWDDVPEPPWTKGNPRLGRWSELGGPRATGSQKLPTPACSRGGMEFDSLRSKALSNRRLCSLCGCGIAGPVYYVFIENASGELKDWVKSELGPLHKSCSLFTAQTCPFLRDIPARVVGFKRYTRTVHDGSTYFKFYEPVETIPYTKASELTLSYRQSIVADAETIDYTTRKYWLDSDMPDLRKCAFVDKKQTQHPAASLGGVGGLYKRRSGG